MGPLLVLTGKTASGKDTVMLKLLQKFPDFKRIVTTTTRAPREDEKNRVDYNFISEEEFKQKQAQDEFIEYVEYGGNLYGTEKQQFINNLGNSLVWRIDPSMAGRLKEFIKTSFNQSLAEMILRKLVVIYLTVDNQIVLERLHKRGLGNGEIQKRMDQDKIFWDKYGKNYDFVVENIPGKLENTVEKVIQIIQDETAQKN